MATKKSKSNNKSSVTPINEERKLLSYEITDEPTVNNNGYRLLPESIQNELDNIHGQLTSQKLSAKKKSALVLRLEELEVLYPSVPVISNYLVIAYSMTNSSKVNACIQDNYRKHPGYLFARIQYAEQCLKNNELEKIKEIFKEGFDLKLLYPERELFHVSEFVGLGSFLCRYFVEIGEQEKAEMILQALEKIAPDHPAVEQAAIAVEENLLVSMLKQFASGQQNKRNSKKNSSSFKA